MIGTLCAVGTLWLTGCGAHRPQRSAEPLQHPEQALPSRQPIAAKDSLGPAQAWDTRQQRWLSPEVLRARIETAPLLLLGERHDHPLHHAWQAEILRWLAHAGRRPTVVFEMLEVAQQPELNALREAALRTDDPEHAAELADTLAERVDWAASGCPDWSIYRPIFVEVFRYALKPVGAGLSQRQVRALMQRGPEVLEPDLVRRYGLDAPLPEPMHQELLDALHAAHCDMLPEPMHEPMAVVQRARDALMAEQLRTHAEGDGAVLIAGGGHVNRQRGVPWYLQRVGHDALSIGFVSSDRAAVEAMAADAPYDVVWLTPPPPDPEEDPCDALRRRVGKPLASLAKGEAEPEQRSQPPEPLTSVCCTAAVEQASPAPDPHVGCHRELS